MQRGILKHYAHVLPRIFAERISWGHSSDGVMADDQRALLKWSEGHLRIDMMRGTCVRDHLFNETLWVAGELQAWLAGELGRQSDPPQDVAATLEVEFVYRVEPVSGWEIGRIKSRFDCTATVTTGGRSYVDMYTG